MRKAYVSIAVVLVLFFLASTAVAQTRTYRAGIITVSRWLETLRGAPILNTGYYRQTYSGNAADAFRLDYTGSGNKAFHLLANGSSILSVAKSGSVGIVGSVLLSGPSRYLNFSSTMGASGYGFWDDSGTLKWKDSGGSWAVFGGGAGLWTQNTGYIYPTTTTNSVNIATGESYMQNGNRILETEQSLFNLHMGHLAGASITTGEENTNAGWMAGNANDTGFANATFGYNAGAMATCSSLTAIGAEAGDSVTSGGGTYLGRAAGSSVSSGVSNTIAGNFAGSDISTTSYNSIFGDIAGKESTSTGGSYFGYKAGYKVTGSNGVSIGKESGVVATSGSGFVYVGADSGAKITDGTGDIAIGYKAGDDLTTGDYCIHIGYNAYVASGQGDQKYSIGLGYFAKTTASNQWVVGSSEPLGEITDAYFGQGVTKVSPGGITLNASGGSGTDNVGGDLTLAGGKSTGNATPGAVVFGTSDPGASGATLQALSEKMKISDDGVRFSGTSKYRVTTRLPMENFRKGVTAPTETIKGNIAGLLFDADNELIYVQFCVPKDWDAASDMDLAIYCVLNQAETANDDIDWETIITPVADHENTGTAGTQTPSVNHDIGNVTADADMHLVTLTIDYDDATAPIARDDNVFIALSRTSNVGTAGYVGGVVVTDVCLSYVCDRLGEQ